MYETFSHTVYEVGIDSLPGFTDTLQIQSQFLVCCDCSAVVVDSCQKVREKLQRFLGKEICTASTKTNKKYTSIGWKAIV